MTFIFENLNDCNYFVVRDSLHRLTINGVNDGVFSCAAPPNPDENSVSLMVDPLSIVDCNKYTCAGVNPLVYNNRFKSWKWEIFGGSIGSLVLLDIRYDSTPYLTVDLNYYASISLSSGPIYEIHMYSIIDCCTAGIGEMVINNTDPCKCTFEVSPKTGCP